MRNADRRSKAGIGRRDSFIAEPLESRRLLSAGFLDPTFGTNGTVTQQYNGNNDGVASVVQADGKIIVVGDTQAAGANKQAFIARFNADGSPDTSYGTNGVTFLSEGAGQDTIATGVAIDTNGNAVVCGVVGSGISGSAWVARYLPTGQLDTSFASTGSELLSLGGPSEASGVAINSGGTIAVAGTVLTDSGSGMAIQLLNADGSDFTSFGGTGEGVNVVTGQFIVGTCIAPTLSTDHFIIGGFDFNPLTGKMTFVTGAFNPDGSVATHWGDPTTFLATANFGKNIEPCLGVAVDPTTHNVIAVGATSNGAVALLPELPTTGDSGHATDADFAVAEFDQTGALVTSFNGTGMATVGFTGTGGKGDIAGASGVVLQSDGKIVLSGGAEDLKTGQSNFATARFTATGTLDTTYGSGGTQQTDFGASDGAFGMTIQPDDEVIEVGHTKVNTTDSSLAMLRYTNDASSVTGPPASSANLVPTVSATLPPNVVGGAKATGFKGSVKITNSGTATATGTAAIDLFLAPTQTLDTTVDTALPALSAKVNLKPGASMNVPLKLASFPDLDGSFFLIAQVSGAGSSAANAAASSGSVNIAPAFIDLADSNVTVKPTTVAPGKKVTISATVLNSGNTTASGPLGVQLEVATDAQGDGATDVGSPLSTNIKILSGKTKVIKATLAVPAGFAAGSYFLVVDIDPANTFSETNLANNVAVAANPVTVT